MYKFLYFVTLVFMIGYGIKYADSKDTIIDTTEYVGQIDKSYRHSLILKDKDNNRYEVQHTRYMFGEYRCTVGSEIHITQYKCRSGITNDVYYRYKIVSYKGNQYSGWSNTICSIRKI